MTKPRPAMLLLLSFVACVVASGEADQPAASNDGNVITERIKAEIKLSPMSETLPVPGDDWTGLSGWNYVTRKRIRSTAEGGGISISDKIMLKDEKQAVIVNLAEKSLSIQFMLEMSFWASLPPPGLVDIFRGTFDTESEVEEYLEALRNDPELFNHSITSVEARVLEEDSDTTGAIAGGVSAAGFVLAFIAACFIYRHSRKKRQLQVISIETPEAQENSMEDISHESQAQQISPSKQVPDPAKQQEYTHEIVIDTSADDVSTLATETAFAKMTPADAAASNDEATASINFDYDFIKEQYAGIDFELMSRSATESSLTAAEKLAKRQIMFADDTTFEKQYVKEDMNKNYVHEEKTAKFFEIQAPPGQLGIFLDTPNDGVPATVKEIKPGSILGNHLRIGDRLIAVDGQNVSSMPLSDILDLIYRKGDHHRKLLFVRSKEEMI